MTERRRFANVRHDLRAELPDVYRDAARLGTWLQLYLAADTAWPDAAEVPRVVDGQHLERLTEAHVVYLDVTDPWRYRMPYLDRYRDGEVEAGRRAYMNRKDQRDQTPPPEPDYRRLMCAFYPDGRVPPPTSLPTPLHTPLPTTNGRTDGRTLRPSSFAPDGTTPSAYDAAVAVVQNLKTGGKR